MKKKISDKIIKMGGKIIKIGVEIINYYIKINKSIVLNNALAKVSN